MLAEKQINRAHRCNKHGAGDIARAHRMDEFLLGDNVEDDRPEIADFHPHRVRIEMRTDGIQHPAIGDENPKRRKIGAYRDEPSDAQMPYFRQTVPAKEEETDKGGFEEKGHQTFDGEWRAEDVADIMAVIGPVHPELEFHGDAGGDAHGEIDAEQNAPEFGRLAPNLLASHDIDALHDSEQNRKAKRQGHEEKMIKGGQAELQPGELHNVHGGAHGKMLLGCGPAVEGPIRRCCMLSASILGRCPGLNTKRAAATMTISLTAKAKVTSGTSGWRDIAGVLLRCGKTGLIWISSSL
jgi:hypothetical protein